MFCLLWALAFEEKTSKPSHRNGTRNRNQNAIAASSVRSSARLRGRATNKGVLRMGLLEWSSQKAVHKALRRVLARCLVVGF